MMCVLKHTAAKNSVHDTAKDAIMTRDFSQLQSPLHPAQARGVAKNTNRHSFPLNAKVIT